MRALATLAVDAVFATLGVDGVWQQDGMDEGRRVRALVLRRDAAVEAAGFEARLRTEAVRLEVRVAEVPERPRAGAVFTTGHGAWEVTEPATADDGEALVWVCHGVPR